MQRKIIHIDCDCYYAALEMRDFPSLRGKPVAVGGRGPRSVLATCNYEARRYGVRSAMPSRIALSKCPHLIIQPSRFDVYRSVSRQILAVFSQYSDRIEPLSLDEAFIDVTGSTWFGGSATLLAEHIKQQIFDTVGITVSAGVAPNKFLAKIASDWQKPNGLFVVPPDSVDDFLKDLPVKKISGVGDKFNQRLESLGITTCGELRSWSLPRLVQMFGKMGPWLYQRCRGEDDRSVGTRGERKSLSIEHTFPVDVTDQHEQRDEVARLFESLTKRLESKKSQPIKGIVLKIRFSDFSTHTIERSWSLTQSSFEKLLDIIRGDSEKGIRLIGLGVKFDDHYSESQLSLWSEATDMQLY